MTIFSLQSKLAVLNDGLAARGLPRLSARIGLNTGKVSLVCSERYYHRERRRRKSSVSIMSCVFFSKVLVGNLGSLERLDYTVIGDAVNLASRLEALNKRYDTLILISHAVQSQV